MASSLPDIFFGKDEKRKTPLRGSMRHYDFRCHCLCLRFATLPNNVSPALLMYAGCARVIVPRVCRVPVGALMVLSRVNLPSPILYLLSHLLFSIIYFLSYNLISQHKRSFPRGVVSLTIR